MTVSAIIDECSFERRFYAGDDTFIDIAFALFFAGGFDIEIDEFLSIDDGDAQFFRLRRIE